MRTRNDMKTIATHKNNTQGARRTSSVPPLGNRILSIESEVRTVMGGFWKNEFTRMALLSVLALVMVFGVIGTADAAVSLVSPGWTAAPQIANNTTTSTTQTYTPAAGSNRVVVVMVAAHTNGTTATTVTADWGNGSNWQAGRFVGVSANAQRRQIWYFYWNEADLASISGGDRIRVNNSVPGSGWASWFATYSGVEQNSGSAGTSPGTPCSQGAGYSVHDSLMEYPNQVTGYTWPTLAPGPMAVQDGGSLAYAIIKSTTDTVTDNISSTWNGAQTQVGTAYADLFYRDYATGTTDVAATMSWANPAYMGYGVISLNQVACSDGSPTSANIPGSQIVGGSVDLTSLYTMAPAGNGSVTGYTIDGAPVSTPWDSTGITGPQGVNFCVEWSDPDCGGSTGSNCNTVTVDNTCAATAPGDLADTVVAATHVDLQWTGSCGGNDTYTIYRDGSPVSVCQNIACSGGTMSCSDTTVNINTSYTYTVRGYNTAGTCESGDSNPVPVTTPASPYLLDGCSGCHNYPPADGTRDGATGSVVGSHSVTQHTAGTCSDCHVAPATETSTDFGHRNGNIQMASPIHGQGTSYYDKDKSGTHTGADDTFAQVNTPVLGNCDNTYCHSNGTSVITGSILSNTSPDWGGSSTCESCHGTGGGDDGRPNYPNNSPKRNTHGNGTNYGLTHQAQSCDTCHVGVSGSAGSYSMDSATHDNGAYNLQPALGYNQSSGTCATPEGGGPGCHSGSATWGGNLACTDCHGGVLNAPNASTASSGTVTTRPDVVSEFGLAWGHKNNKRNAVAPADCIVCHLEGDYATQGKSATYHGDGYVDLRNPDGTGAERITDNTGAAFRFVRYSVSFASGSRTTSLGNTIAEVVTVKFCMACHDANGATNSTARSDNGGTGTAAMPFGGVTLGTNYSAANDAIGTQGLINVSKQFAQGNSSRHPVGAPNSRMYPYNNRLAVPYDGLGTARNSNTQAANSGSPRVAANSVVMVCDDCHTDSTTITSRVTDRTITAHGNASSIAGTYFVTGPTLCLTCHIQGPATGPYNDNSATGGRHWEGSAFAGNTTRPRNAMNYCNVCHFSQNTNYAEANRPRYAQDVHGFDQMYGGGGWPGGNASGMLPRAFMRSSQNWGGSWPSTYSPRPYSAPGITTGASNCGGSFTFNTGDSGASCSNNGHNNYQPGGSY